MNQGEKICKPYQDNVRCFENIPLRFEFDGNIDDNCSFIFPPGYSMYVEEFTLDDFGPDNFVLSGEYSKFGAAYDEKYIGYNLKLKWKDRRQSFWRNLETKHPLYEESDMRLNHCIKTLKVTQSANIRVPSFR